MARRRSMRTSGDDGDSYAGRRSTSVGPPKRRSARKTGDRRKSTGSLVTKKPTSAKKRSSVKKDISIPKEAAEKSSPSRSREVQKPSTRATTRSMSPAKQPSKRKSTRSKTGIQNVPERGDDVENTVDKPDSDSNEEPDVAKERSTENGSDSDAPPEEFSQTVAKAEMAAGDSDSDSEAPEEISQADARKRELEREAEEDRLAKVEAEKRKAKRNPLSKRVLKKATEFQEKVRQLKVAEERARLAEERRNRGPVIIGGRSVDDKGQKIELEPRDDNIQLAYRTSLHGKEVTIYQRSNQSTMFEDSSDSEDEDGDDIDATIGGSESAQKFAEDFLNGGRRKRVSIDSLRRSNNDKHRGRRKRRRY